MNKLYLKYLLPFLTLAILFVSNLSAQDTLTHYSKGKKFLMQAKHDSATIYLNKALQQQPENLAILEDQVYLEYLKRDFVKGMQIGKPLLERSDVSVKTFQVVGLIYKEIADYKEAKKLYDQALLKFPTSGVLYYEYGEMFQAMNNASEAIKQFEKGIEMDPGYGNNYYQAAYYYASNNIPLWAILYAENFVNIESYSARTEEVKLLLTDLYKRISMPGYLNSKKHTPFTSAIVNTFSKQPPVTLNNLTVESLTALRSSFINDWNLINSSRFPYKLFEYHTQLIQQGLFDAYNQWLFGNALNSSAYTKWSSLNTDKIEAFKKYQGGRIFKIPANQYYQAR